MFFVFPTFFVLVFPPVDDDNGSTSTKGSGVFWSSCVIPEISLAGPEGGEGLANPVFINGVLLLFGPVSVTAAPSTDVELMTGSAAGSAAGSVAGSAAGSVAGSAAGSVAGSAAGSVAGSAAGSVAGSAAGSVAGSAAGSVAGSAAGSVAGSAAGSVAGSAAGSVAGSAAGSVAGSAAGSVAGSAAGSVAGSAAGSVAGSAAGSVAVTAAVSGFCTTFSIGSGRIPFTIGLILLQGPSCFCKAPKSLFISSPPFELILVVNSPVLRLTDNFIL